MTTRCLRRALHQTAHVLRQQSRRWIVAPRHSAINRTTHGSPAVMECSKPA